jgi:hypothetical protein
VGINVSLRAGSRMAGAVWKFRLAPVPTNASWRRTLDNEFVHVIACDDANEKLVIRRRFSDGWEVLFTEISYAAIARMGFDAFAKQLGENLVLDQAPLRRIFGLDD